MPAALPRRHAWTGIAHHPIPPAVAITILTALIWLWMLRGAL